MSPDSILQLQKEVDELEQKHKESISDSSLTLEEREAIAKEYTAKYNELQHLGISQVSIYDEQK
ncbi:hypothetical protein QMZ62_05585 [Serratia sp. PF2-63]|uniref:hypothetical protein n=1 Tax=unclassified Serratia (in: enterobacteria) TaxID=2647522 RepID=UPI0024AFB3A4|nr:MULTISPECIES: hypothetical protein [unclassified Serratia (in: enterobacteria)]MDI6977552.1 hypothetical protein [Serratia sp. Se-RSBMAAmG]MDI9262430.1 hypothetical protein [Serratia sp. PF2-63]MDI9271283.1 hypothetical protein [Serratia sp. PF-27]